MATSAPPVCASHRRRTGVAQCAVCNRPMCSECIVHTPVGQKCQGCTGSAPSRPAPHTGAEAPAGRGRRPVIVALVGATVLVAAVVAYGVLGRGSGGRREVDTAAAPAITERPVQFVGAGGARLNGTLTLPALEPGAAAVPGALIVSGWGAVDRDSVIAGGSHDGTADALSTTLAGSRPAAVDTLYKDLGLALAKAGVASLRWDKRGSAAARAGGDQVMSFDDEVGDVRAAVDFLAQRKEVAGAPLALIGHDEGGVLVMRAGADNPKVKAVALVSAPGRPLADVVADDLARSRDAATAAAFRDVAAQVVATGTMPAADSMPPYLRTLLPAASAPYLKSLFAVDPQADAGKVAVPAVVVAGDADPSHTPADVERLSSALTHGLNFIQGAPGTDHNLGFGAAGHVHMNNNQTAEAPGHDDAALTGLATWLKNRLSS